MRWSRWRDWTSGDPRWAVQVIDTTGRSVDESAAEIRQWIAGARSAFAAGRLSLDAGKWATVTD